MAVDRMSIYQAMSSEAEISKDTVAQFVGMPKNGKSDAGGQGQEADTAKASKSGTKAGGKAGSKADWKRKTKGYGGKNGHRARIGRGRSRSKSKGKSKGMGTKSQSHKAATRKRSQRGRSRGNRWTTKSSGKRKAKLKKLKAMKAMKERVPCGTGVIRLSRGIVRQMAVE